jgi:hypothetical protein
MCSTLGYASPLTDTMSARLEELEGLHRGHGLKRLHQQPCRQTYTERNVIMMQQIQYNPRGARSSTIPPPCDIPYRRPTLAFFVVVAGAAP